MFVVNPFRDEIVLGEVAPLEEGQEEVGVDIAQVMDVIVRDQDIKHFHSHATVLSSKQKSPHQTENIGSSSRRHQPAPPPPPLTTTTTVKKPSMSQSSSGFFSTESSSRRTMTTITLKLMTPMSAMAPTTKKSPLRSRINKSDRARWASGLRFPDVPVEKDFATSEQSKIASKLFESELRSVRTSPFDSSRRSLQHSETPSKFCQGRKFLCRARLGLLHSSEHLDVDIVMNSSSMLALDDFGVRCDIPLAEIDHIGIDEFMELCCITLRNEIRFTILYFESKTLSEFLASIEFEARRSLANKFRPILSTLTVSAESAAIDLEFFCVLNYLEIDSKICQDNSFPVLEADLMHLELDGAEEDTVKGRTHWQSGHFLLKLSTLYFFHCLHPDSSKDLPDKHWVLNCSDKKPFISDSMIDESVRPYTLCIHFQSTTLCLSLSSSKEKDVWFKELTKATEFKESDMDAFKTSKVTQRLDTVCLALDSRNLAAFKYYPHGCASYVKVAVGSIVDVVSHSETSVKVKHQLDQHWQLHFRVKSQAERFKDVLTKKL